VRTVPTPTHPTPTHFTAARSTPDRSALTARLRAAGCVYAEDEASLLLEAADDDAHLEAMVERRVAGEPLEQVLGWAEFMGLRLVVAPGVFVPRARTGLLARLAVEGLGPDARVLDLCCGTGALAAVLARDHEGIELWASDIDRAAVGCATRNLPAAQVRQGDLFDALPPSLRGSFDVVVVNAPYVPSAAVATMPREARDHEALVTLDGGRDGLDLQRRVIAQATGWLVPGGRLIIETSRGQAGATLALFSAAGFDARVVLDDDLDATAVVGTTGRGTASRG